MKKVIRMVGTLLFVILFSTAVLAAEKRSKTECGLELKNETKTEIGVCAKAEYHIEGEYVATIENKETVILVDEETTTVTVTDIPDGAVQLVIVPILTEEQEAWSWINTCFDSTGTPIHTFDIYFLDQNGSRINADGATVTIDCPHCKGTPVVYSLTTEGKVQMLSGNVRSVSVTFTTDGSHYYVLAEAQKATEKETEAATEKPTEKETEAETTKPTEKETEAATEKPTEKETEAETTKPTEKETETEPTKPTEKETEAETTKPTEKETEAETTKPTEKETEAETTKPTESETDSAGQLLTARGSAATGDDAPLMFWMILLLGSAVCAAVLLSERRYRKR